jgi:hypothetical membrane protein
MRVTGITPTRNRALEDGITTLLGLVSAIALVLNQNGVYPKVTSIVSGVALALLGVFTNKLIKG